jgi:oxygen-independent coproporphyrinogen-3 oxidase
MLWLPGQSRASAVRSASIGAGLAPEHLSVYLLEIYPNSPLRDAMARALAAPAGASVSEWAQLADDEAADMYLEVFATLDRAGYEQYEISNTARPGFWSRHNVKYWQGGHWRGFGCGAHSTVRGRRWRNVAATVEYIANIRDGVEVRRDQQVLDEDARIAEALFMGLRLAAGIDRRNFSSRYGVDPWSRHGEVFDGCVSDGLMWQHESRFGLTRQGMLVANEILASVV